jgi:hypothetical protein
MIALRSRALHASLRARAATLSELLQHHDNRAELNANCKAAVSASSG